MHAHTHARTQTHMSSETIGNSSKNRIDITRSLIQVFRNAFGGGGVSFPGKQRYEDAGEGHVRTVNSPSVYVTK